MKKIHRSSERWIFFISKSKLCFELFDAVGANILAFVVDDVLGIVAEDACGMILMKNDVVTLHEYLESVLLSNIQGTAQLYGKNDAAELIYFSDYSG